METLDLAYDIVIGLLFVILVLTAIELLIMYVYWRVRVIKRNMRRRDWERRQNERPRRGDIWYRTNPNQTTAEIPMEENHVAYRAHG